MISSLGQSIWVDKLYGRVSLEIQCVVFLAGFR